MYDGWKRFGEAIGSHGGGPDVFDRDDITLDKLAQMVVPDIDLFSQGVSDGVVCDGDGRLIISEQKSGAGGGKAELGEV